MLRNRYERNPNSNESVRVFDSSSKKLLTELATLYGDSQAIEDLKRSNFEKEPQAPEDRLIGLYNLNLSMFRELSWRGSVLLEPSEKDKEDETLFSRPTMSLQIKWTHSETRKDTIVSELISVQIPTIGISLVDNSNRLESTTEVTYLGTRDVVATYVHFGDGRKTYKLSIRDVGMDNPYPDAHYRSVMAPTSRHVRKKKTESHQPWLSVYVDQMPPLYPATCFNVIHVSIGDMSLTLDSEWIYAVISFLDRLRLSVGSKRKMIGDNSTITSSRAITRVVTEDMRTEYVLFERENFDRISQTQRLSLTSSRHFNPVPPRISFSYHLRLIVEYYEILKARSNTGTKDFVTVSRVRRTS